MMLNGKNQDQVGGKAEQNGGQEIRLCPRGHCMGDVLGRGRARQVFPPAL